MQAVIGATWEAIVDRSWGPQNPLNQLGHLHTPERTKDIGRPTCRGHESASSWMLWPCRDAKIMLEAAGLVVEDVYIP